MTNTLRARFDGKVLIPLDPVDLPQDRVLEVQVREDADDPPPGSPAALMRLMELPRIATPEDIDELDRLIEQSKLPFHYTGAFDDRDG